MLRIYVHLLCPFPGCRITCLSQDSSSHLTVSYPKGHLCLLVSKEWRGKPVLTAWCWSIFPGGWIHAEIDKKQDYEKICLRNGSFCIWKSCHLGSMAALFLLPSLLGLFSQAASWWFPSPDTFLSPFPPPLFLGFLHPCHFCSFFFFFLFLLLPLKRFIFLPSLIRLSLLS